MKNMLKDAPNTMISNIKYLSKGNFEQLNHWINGRDSQDSPKFEGCQTQEFVKVSHDFLTFIQGYLRETSKLLEELLQQGETEVKDEYRFLRNLWTSQKNKLHNEEWEDRCDSLNKTIGILKKRMKYLTVQQNFQLSTINDHSQEASPHLLNKLANQQMYIEELETQLHQNREQVNSMNEKLSSMNQKLKETESKFHTSKDKTKKLERKFFEMTKQKVGLEKKVFDMEVKEKMKTSVMDGEEQKENNEDTNMRWSTMFIDISGVKKIEQKCTSTRESQPVSNVLADLNNSLIDTTGAQIKRKFKHLKKQTERKRKVMECKYNGNISADLDSSMRKHKFERTNSKKTLYISSKDKYGLKKINSDK